MSVKEVKHLLATSDFRSDSVHQSALILYHSYEIPKASILQATKLSRFSFNRAQKAMRDGRKAGRNGRPPKLTSEEERKVVERVIENVDKQQAMSVADVAKLVCVCFISISFYMS